MESCSSPFSAHVAADPLSGQVRREPRSTEASTGLFAYWGRMPALRGRGTLRFAGVPTPTVGCLVLPGADGFYRTGASTP